MFEFISENPDTLALSIAVIAGLFGFVKWLDARTLLVFREIHNVGQDREAAIRSSETMSVSSCKTAISAWRRQYLLHQLVVANKITV